MLGVNLSCPLSKTAHEQWLVSQYPITGIGRYALFLIKHSLNIVAYPPPQQMVDFQSS